MKRQTGFRLTERAHEWLKTQARERGISKNDVVQELINSEIANSVKREARGATL
jgi:predicted HicB family RNase H-like nuclease